jgi:hypothetical protein
MNVKIIKEFDGTSTLIEWFDKDGLHRGTLPMEVKDDLDIDILDMAVPYGIDFEYCLSQSWADVTPKSIADRIHAHGIWTAEDIANRPLEVEAALREVYSLDFQRIALCAFEYNRIVGG